MLSLEMGYEFTASNGWLEAWQKRHGVKWAALCGEAAEVPADVVADWTVCLPHLTAGYALEMANVEEEAYMLPPEGAAYDELLSVVSWGDYVAMDEATSTTDIDDWEADLIARARGDQVEDDDDSSGDEGGIEEAAAPAAISTKVALGHVGQLVSFALLANDASMVEAVTKLQNIIQEHSMQWLSRSPLGTSSLPSD